jgi:hypothetical protein
MINIVGAGGDECVGGVIVQQLHAARHSLLHRVARASL